MKIKLKRILVLNSKLNTFSNLTLSLSLGYIYTMLDEK